MEMEGIKMDMICNFKGANGQIELYSDKIVISHHGVGARMNGCSKKDNITIPIEQIERIQFMAAKTEGGFIQFTVKGHENYFKDIHDLTKDENCVTFGIVMNKNAEQFKYQLAQAIKDKPINILKKVKDIQQFNPIIENENIVESKPVTLKEKRAQFQKRAREANPNAFGNNHRNTVIEESILSEFKGINGKIELFKDRVIIKRGGFQSVYFQGRIKGEKTIYFDQLSSVQFKQSGFFRGYFQFTVPGGSENLKGIQAAYHDENSIVFSQNKNSEAAEFKKHIDLTIKDYKQKPEPSSISNDADIIRKFKQLFDDGIITSEEYEKKKIQLLSK
jgi:hypothetical protein